MTATAPKIRFTEAGDRFIEVNGVTEGEFSPSSQGCYLNLFVVQDDGNVKTICVARFAKYGGRAKGLAEAKRWVKAAFAEYPTGTELYAALQRIDPNTGMTFSPGALIPVPPPRNYRRGGCFR
jgi:hypothetical protein